MDKTKFFTEEVRSGSRGEASDEDMQCGIADFGAEEMPDDSTFFMPEEGGGFVGRPGWEPRRIRRLPARADPTQEQRPRPRARLASKGPPRLPA
jgi:hypothetical protein